MTRNLRPLSPVVIRRVRTEDWRTIRALRLEMLLDSPLAFITTHPEAAAMPDEVWIERCTSRPDGTTATYAAFDGDVAVGMAVGVDRTRPGRRVVAVVSVYVSPSHRRHGVAGCLMSEVESWAVLRGAHSTSLWVVDGNDGARGFYERIGYRMTLDRQRITAPPVRWETRMEKPLRG